MAVIACCTGIFMTMVLVHIFPAQRTKDVILLLSILMVVALYLMFRFLRPERLVNPEAFFTVAQYVSALKAPDSPFLPTHWITETLWASLKRSQESSRLFEIVLTWTTAASAMVINIWTAGNIHGDWVKIREASLNDPAYKSWEAGAGQWRPKVVYRFLYGLVPYSPLRTPFLPDELEQEEVRTVAMPEVEWGKE